MEWNSCSSAADFVVFLPVLVSYPWTLHLWPHFTVEHVLFSTCGGLLSIHHDELRDMTAGFLNEVCHNVGIEPRLQPLTGEHLTLRSANREGGARLDIAADKFWGRDRNHAIFWRKGVQPLRTESPKYFLSQCYKKNKQEKKRVYDQRGAWSFSTSGGMGQTAYMVYKQISSMIAQKHDKTYSKTLHCIRCKLSYSLLHSARRARSSIHHPTTSP